MSDWFRGRGRRGGSENTTNEPEYYEDTHDEQGNYIGKEGVMKKRGREASGIPLEGTANKSYGNIVIYSPSTPEEVEVLIDYLKRGEPAVAKLADLDEALAQRILDFLSGAVYALSGNIQRISGNIFLISPSGVEIKS